MKWYGTNLNLSKNILINSNKARKLKTRAISISISKRANFNNTKLYLYVPSLWNFLILSRTNSINKDLIVFYSDVYFFFLPLFSKFLMTRYDQKTSVFFFFSSYNNNFTNLFWTNFKNIFYSFSRIFFKKLKFKGKGYYIYKNKRNTVAMQFGYSHIKRLFFFYTYVKFLSKTSIIIFGLSKIKINKAAFHLRSVRPINIFTGKGVRFTRQIIYRKTGKISSYR